MFVAIDGYHLINITRIEQIKGLAFEENGDLETCEITFMSGLVLELDEQKTAIIWNILHQVIDAQDKIIQQTNNLIHKPFGRG